MNRKQTVIAAGMLVVLCCLFYSMCAGVVLARYFAASQKRILTEITAGLVEAYPQEEMEIMLLVKKGLQPAVRGEEKTADYLSAYGYRRSDFSSGYLRRATGTAFAGTAVVLLLLVGLQLEKKEVDIFTLLELSAEAVDEIIRARKIRVDIPNHPDITFQGDMEWSTEAFTNLIKNCAEHTPEGGRIIMDYACNPLYTQIMLRDTGTGFVPEELPHVFERFYRGKDAGENGIGIGLSLAKSLIEMQNGFLTAQNLPEGGACFTVRFYHH